MVGDSCCEIRPGSELEFQFISKVLDGMRSGLVKLFHAKLGEPCSLWTWLCTRGRFHVVTGKRSDHIKIHKAVCTDVSIYFGPNGG